MDDHECDQERILQAQQFDETALTQIYDEYHILIYRYIYRRVGDVDTARDLAADVFKRLLQALSKGNGPERAIRAWLYRAAHNLVIDHYRRQQHRQHLPLYDSVINTADDPVYLAETRISATAVRTAIQQLTSDQQQVITLKFLEGFTNEEVATTLGKPIGAVKSLQHRALAALQRQLVPKREEELV